MQEESINNFNLNEYIEHKRSVSFDYSPPLPLLPQVILNSATLDLCLCQQQSYKDVLASFCSVSCTWLWVEPKGLSLRSSSGIPYMLIVTQATLGNNFSGSDNCGRWIALSTIKIHRNKVPWTCKRRMRSYLDQGKLGKRSFRMPLMDF